MFGHVTTEEIKDSIHSPAFVLLLGRIHVPKLDAVLELREKWVPIDGMWEARVLRKAHCETTSHIPQRD